MSQSELRKRTATTLARLQIRYMGTGSLASSFQGIHRSTHDIDVVVSLEPTRADPLLAEFSLLERL